MTSFWDYNMCSVGSNYLWKYVYMRVSGWEWLSNTEYEDEWTNDHVDASPSEWIWEVEWVGMFVWIGELYNEVKKKRSYSILSNAESDK